VAGLHHPALQFHQLALQAEQLAEVATAGELLLVDVGVLVEQLIEVAHVFQQFQLQLFVAVVKQFAVDAADAVDHGFMDQGHGGGLRVGALPPD